MFDATSDSTWKQPAREPARADIDTDDPIPAVEPRQFDLVRAYEPRTIDVDQLTIEHVFAKEHLLGPPLEGTEVETCCPQRRLPVFDPRYRLGRHEYLASRNGRQQPGDRRVFVVAQTDDQIVDPSDLVAAIHAKLAPRDQGEMQELRLGHTRESGSRAKGLRPRQLRGSLRRSRQTRRRRQRACASGRCSTRASCRSAQRSRRSARYRPYPR